MRRSRTRCYHRAARRRAPTAAQIAASKRAWEAALGVVEGRYQKGQVVRDHTGQAWRLTRPGRRYHEEVSALLYPAVPCRLPTAAAAAQRLIAIRRGLPRRDDPAPLDGEDRITWREPREPGWLAPRPEILVAGDVVYGYEPRYDDAPITGWVHDARLARRVRRDIERAGESGYVPRVAVRLRGAAAAARDLGLGLRALHAARRVAS